MMKTRRSNLTGDKELQGVRGERTIRHRETEKYALLGFKFSIL
jgi:hypothetical protein